MSNCSSKNMIVYPAWLLSALCALHVGVVRITGGWSLLSYVPVEAKYPLEIVVGLAGLISLWSLLACSSGSCETNCKK